nr:uncharacterized protein LOC111419214 [Onthophagus taurus]
MCTLLPMVRSTILLLVVSGTVTSYPRGGKDFRGGDSTGSKEANGEPTCEELKAMWRFSKRQSRAAEITNEIPTYRDPFSYNVWEPYYARSRSGGGMRIGNRYKTKPPVYGRVIHKAPLLRLQDLPDKGRVYDMLFGDSRPVEEPRRRFPFRVVGGGTSSGWPPQSGSFQQLKELIRTERAKELQEQRLAEEAAARAAAMKELAESTQRGQSNLRDMSYAYMDMDGRNMREEDSLVRGGLLSFPDILAPAARTDVDDQHYVQDHGYFKDKAKAHTSSLFDTTSYNTDFDGLLF